MGGTGGVGEEGRAPLTIDGAPPRVATDGAICTQCTSCPVMKARFASVDAPAGVEPSRQLSSTSPSKSFVTSSCLVSTVLSSLGGFERL